MKSFIVILQTPGFVLLKSTSSTLKQRLSSSSVCGNMIEQKELGHDENYRYIEEIQYDKDTQRKWRIAKRLDMSTDIEHSFAVPSDRIFVIADNRDEFMDSRLWGNLPHENVIGKVILRIGPKDLWQSYIFFQIR